MKISNDQIQIASMHPLFSAEAPVDQLGSYHADDIFTNKKKKWSQQQPGTANKRYNYQVLSGHVRFRTNAGMTLGITMSFMWYTILCMSLYT